MKTWHIALTESSKSQRKIYNVINEKWNVDFTTNFEVGQYTILQEVNRTELCINGTKVFNVSDSKVYMYNLSVCLQFWLFSLVHLHKPFPAIHHMKCDEICTIFGAFTMVGFCKQVQYQHTWTPGCTQLMVDPGSVVKDSLLLGVVYRSLMCRV